MLTPAIRKFIFGFLLFIFFLLICSACTAENSAQPELIAAHPTNNPIAISPPLPKQAVLVYQLYLELEVRDVEAAARDASDLAYRHGGYPVSTQTWFVDDRQNMILVLAVPTINFDRLNQELHSLGRPVSESVTGEWQQPYPRGQVPYSHITLQLRPKVASIPSINLINGWDPLRTFQTAFAVFLRIFGFFADILIWLLVVVAPFALLAWLGFFLVRRIAGGKKDPRTDEDLVE